jgi:hypothetical protein
VIPSLVSARFAFTETPKPARLFIPLRRFAQPPVSGACNSGDLMKIARCRKTVFDLALPVSLAVVAFCAAMLFGDSVFAQSKPLQFDRDIRPILSDNCFQCHGPDDKHREAGLRLDLKQQAFADRDGTFAFKAGDLDQSEAWQRMTTDDPDLKMPPADSNKKLTSKQIALIKQWIEQGAEWVDHWSFVAPVRSKFPTVSNAKWPRNSIDHFILKRLDDEGLKPSSEAERHTLIRRLSFDLTGLPPTPKEVDAFLNDTSPNAYEKLVDRLLKSRHYGERMALMWLDLARYGDTSVFHADGPRDMWAWRDHIVNRYNENQPFNQFSIEQLAGDLIPNATLKQRLASGFNRNNGTTDEGGAIAEEYRVEYAVDRVKTTSTAWLGMSMECAQCHDHKFDPISQEEYYRFYSFFNVSADAGMQTRGGNAAPKLDIPDPEKEKQLPGLRLKLAAQEKSVSDHRASVEPAFQQWVKDQAAAAVAGSLDQLPSDPLLHFTLDEGKGDTVKDQVDAKRVGKIKGKPQWVPARFGQGLKLDGSNFVELAGGADFERAHKFSYGSWVSAGPKPSGAVVARMDDADGFRGYDLLLSGGYVEVHIVHKWPENAIKVRTKQPIKSDSWHHICATYDGSSKAAGIAIYVDGQPQKWDIQQNGLTETIRTKKPFHIGSRNPGGRLKGTVDDVRVFKRQLTAVEVQALAMSNPITPILAIAADKRTKEQVQTLRDYYLNNDDPKYGELVKQRDKLKAEEVELLKPLTSVMVMQNPGKLRDTFILNRGAYDSPTDKKVTSGTPAILPPMPKDAPQNRLGMAQWLFQADHPLTSRVAVNRYWQLLFGQGLVTTPEDFGSQGEFPSHRELLDWLAVDFRESGWDVKRMLKQMVMSATYRQTSNIRAELLKHDPNNRLLARGPRFRLQGEFIRDNALAVSGLLVTKMGGPGVKPYQPPGLWREVGLGGNPRFSQDHAEKLYRRSIYTYWKRSAPPPSMQIFDAPTREKCAARRPRTNTPLQALVTLNDVQFVEAARNLAQRMMKQGGTGPEDRSTFAYLLAVSRKPRESERSVMLDVYSSSLEHFRKDKKAAKALLGIGESKRDESLDAAEHAAWTVVAGLVLNLDETLTRE